MSVNNVNNFISVAKKKREAIFKNANELFKKTMKDPQPKNKIPEEKVFRVVSKTIESLFNGGYSL